MTPTLTKTFENDEDSQPLAVYHWGEVALREGDDVDWRGHIYQVETADNPDGFSPTMPVAVMSLYRWDSWPPPVGTYQMLEWWAQQQPGHLLELEITASGDMVAVVWTGLISAKGSKDMTIESTPQDLLANWDALVATLGGNVNIHIDKCIFAPVGTITEVQPIESDQFDSNFWRAALRGEE